MSLTELLEDIIIDHLLPLLPLSALLALTCTSKFFVTMCSKPVVWKRKLETDFNYYPSSNTARVSGFKLIYKGIHWPKVYIWGHLGHGRRGCKDEEHTPKDVFVYPVRVKIKKRIVSLVSGGWSFQALDDTGNIYVWGTLDGAAAQDPPLDDPPFSEVGSTASTPIQLAIPTRFTSISCGRRNSIMLDIKHRVWIFTSWGRPNLLTFTGSMDPIPQRHPAIAHTKVIQVSCGYNSFVSFLTQDGRAFVIWVTSGLFHHQVTTMNNALDGEDDGYPARAVDGVVKCIPIKISAEPLMLPELPLDLPDLRTESENFGVEERSPPKLIVIAAGRHFIVGLTDQGHVLCIDLGGEDASERLEEMREMFTSGERQWVYLPQLCEIEDVIKDPVFSNEGDSTSSVHVTPPNSLKITHISVHMHYVTVYSTEPSLVIVGQISWRDGDFQVLRHIPSDLQNRSIISVVSGESHYAALDKDGQVHTWGFDQRGSLGLGLLGRDESTVIESKPRVQRPTPIHLNRDAPEKQMFCFSVTAAGWQTGVLAFDLDDTDSDEEPIHEDNSSVAPSDSVEVAQPLQVNDDSEQSGLRQRKQSKLWRKLKRFYGTHFAKKGE